MNEKVYGLDCYNQALTGGVSMPLRNKNADTDHIPCIIIEHHPNDSRTQISKDQKNVQSLTQRMGTGGGNIPLVMVRKK